MSSMSLEQAVRNSLEAERAAERFYRLLAKSTEDQAARSFLHKMAALEEAHAQTIEQMALELRTGKLPSRPDDNVELIETAPAWADLDNISLDEAMEIALENERHAALYYGALADATQGKLHALFQQITGDENRHAEAISGAIAEHRARQSRP